MAVSYFRGAVVVDGGGVSRGFSEQYRVVAVGYDGDGIVYPVREHVYF